MKLISCDIAGFGKFENVHMDFSDGLNAAVWDNGWGKSTLLIYIKAMLFGMEYSRKKNVLVERDHYRPWEASSYGGSLTIETDGRRYRIERHFGRRNTDDTFALYDDVTGMESEDYTEAIGQELFGVDRESFERSVFVAHESLETGMTDSLNAKIGDMATASDDINNFDNAISSLEEAKKVYDSRSKTNPSKLRRIRARMRRCNEALEQIPAINDSIDKQRNVLEEKRQSLIELKTEKNRLLDEIAVSSKKEQNMGVYKEKIETSERLSAVIKEQEDFFGGNIPERSDIDKVDECERQLELDTKQRDSLKQEFPSDEEIARMETLFGSGVPSEEDIDVWVEKAENVLSLRLKSEHLKMSEDDAAKLNDLKSYFSEVNPTDEEIKHAMSDATDLAQLNGMVDTLEEQYRNVKIKNEMTISDSLETGRPSGMLYGVFGVLVLLAGAIAFTVALGGPSGTILGIVFFAAAAAVAILVFSSRKKSTREKNDRESSMKQEEENALEALRQKQEERDAKKQKTMEFLSGFLVSPQDSYTQMISEIQKKKEAYDRLLSQEEQSLSSASGALEELASLQVELYTSLSKYASEYDMDLYVDHSESELLEKIKEDVKKYEEYTDNMAAYTALELSINSCQKTVDEFLSRYPDNGMSVKERLLDIRRRLDHYKNNSVILARAQAQIAEYEKTNEIDEETKSVEELQKRQTVLDDRIDELNEQIVKAKETLSETTDKLEELEEEGDEIIHLRQEEAECRAKIELYDDTISYLTKAKEAFLAKYMGPLREGLKKYASTIGGVENPPVPVESFSLDMNLNIKITDKGTTRSGEYLSSGYRDMLFVCARLALLDVMYTNEKPVLILDDPFANLDESKIRQAMDMLKDISRDRQILYYTCHSSRMP